MGNQVQKEHIRAAQSQGKVKFADILDQQLNQFSDSQIHAFLDRVVDQVDSEYEQSPGPEPKIGPKLSKRRTGDSDAFKVRKIDHINSLYQMEEKISQGSSCTVMKAREFKTGDVVAVKQMPKAQLFNTRLFQKEVEMLSVLDHPNILKLKDFYIDKHRYYVVTEYLSGGNLFENLLREKSFDEEDAASYIRPILSALTYVHARGIAHRDVKFSNCALQRDISHFHTAIVCGATSSGKNVVFTEPNGELKLIDFGDAQLCHKKKTYFDFIGTLHYLSPESAGERSAETLKKSDIWAVGVIAYLLVCGTPPFAGRDRKSTIRKIMAHDGKLKYPSNVDLSDSCKEFIESLLCPDPDLRPSASEALEHEWLNQPEEEDEEVEDTALLMPTGSSNSYLSVSYSRDSAHESSSTLPGFAYGGNSDPTMTPLDRSNTPLSVVAPLIGLQEDEEEDFDFDQLDHIDLDQFLDEVHQLNDGRNDHEMVEIKTPDHVLTPPAMTHTKGVSQFVYCDDEYEMSPQPTETTTVLRSVKSDGALL